jgi:general secretion pathway protein L
MLTNMRLLLRRWIDVLGAMYFAQLEMWRARTVLVVSCENGQLVIRKAPPDEDGAVLAKQSNPREQSSVLTVLAAGERVSAEGLQAARKGIVILEFPIENVAVRRLAVPVQARDVVAGIVRNQIERLSPWQPDKAIYGFDTAVDSEDAVTLGVRIVIAARAAVDCAREQLAASGLAADRIVAHLPNADSAKAITLWSRLADISSEDRGLIRRRIGVGIGAVIAASFGLTAWATISANVISGASEDVATRSDALRRHLQSPLTLRSAAASLPPQQREWYNKQTSPSAIIVLEALSQALPDGAYLTELSLQGATLRIVGLAKDAPPLVAPLEHSGALTDVHFFSPTTREPDGAHFRFHIEGRAQPTVELGKDQ